MSTSLDVFRGLDTDTDLTDLQSASATSCERISFARRTGAILGGYGVALHTVGGPNDVAGSQLLGHATFVRSDSRVWHVARTPRGWWTRAAGASTWTQRVSLGSSTPWAVPQFAVFYDRMWCVDGVGIWSWNGDAFTPYVGSTSTKRNWPPWGSQLVVSHFERLWTGGFFGAPGRLVYSQVGALSPSTALNTVTFSTLNVFNVGRQDADDPVTCLMPQYGQVSNLLIFKRRSIHALIGNDPTTFDIDILANRVGCVGSQAAVHAPGGVYWLDHLRVMHFDGMQPMTSVSRPLAEHLRKRVLENPGYQLRTYFWDTLSAKNLTKYAIQATAHWSVATLGGHTTAMCRKSAAAYSSWFGLAASVPCNSYVASLTSKLGSNKSAARQRINMYVRRAAPADSNSKYKGILISYGNFSAPSYASTSLPPRKLLVGIHTSTSSTPYSTLASVAVSTAPYYGWFRLIAEMKDNRLLVSISCTPTLSKTLEVSDTRLLDPRSTMHWAWRLEQWSTVGGASTAACDSVLARMYQCNSFSRVGYSPADRTVRVLTASTDSGAQDKALVYDTLSEQWGTARESAWSYGTYIHDTSKRELLAVCRKAASTRYQFAYEDRVHTLAGAAVSCYWRSNYVHLGAPAVVKVLKRAAVEFDRQVGKTLHLLVSAKGTPWGDTGPTEKHSFPMADSPARLSFNLAGRYFRFTLAGSFNTSAYNVSRLHLIWEPEQDTLRQEAR